MDRDGETGSASGSGTEATPAERGGSTSLRWDVPELASGWTITTDDADLWRSEHQGGCTLEAATRDGNASGDDLAASEADLASYLDEQAGSGEQTVEPAGRCKSRALRGTSISPRPTSSGSRVTVPR